MKRTKNTLFAVLCLLAMLPPITVSAAEDSVEPADTSDWVCRLCPISGGWLGDWDLGLIYVADPTPRFADYRGLDDEGFYLEASGECSEGRCEAMASFGCFTTIDPDRQWNGLLAFGLGFGWLAAARRRRRDDD